MDKKAEQTFKNLFEVLNGLSENLNDFNYQDFSDADLEDLKMSDENAMDFAKKLSELFDIDDVKIKINAPEKNIDVNFNRNDYEKEMLSSERLTKNSNTDNENTNKPKSKQEETQCNCKCSCKCDSSDKDEHIALVLIDCANTNNLLYNALKYIYSNTNALLEKYKLYDVSDMSDVEYMKEKGQIKEIRYAIIPNIWGKVSQWDVRYLTEVANIDTDILYLIDLETFALKQISYLDLTKCIMSQLQEYCSSLD